MAGELAPEVGALRQTDVRYHGGVLTLAPLQLVPGHIHQAWCRTLGGLVTILPAADGRWHLTFNQGTLRVTEEPVSGEVIQKLLEEWHVAPAGPWRHWPAPPAR